jgi:hypothetical protein
LLLECLPNHQRRHKLRIGLAAEQLGIAWPTARPPGAERHSGTPSLILNKAKGHPALTP